MAEPKISSNRPIDLPNSDEERGWRALRYFSLYRIVISGLFAVLALFGKFSSDFVEVDLQQFALTAYIYLGLSILAQAAVEGRWIAIRHQVYAQVLLDIIALTVFMRATGGIAGGFGILLVVAVAGGCLFVRLRAAIFLAAISTLAILGETILGIWHLHYPAAGYTQAGLLGAVLFGTALLSSILAEQARRSEALAAQQALDIENLSRLNEYIVQRMRSGIIVIDDAHRAVLVNEAALSMIAVDDVRLDDQTVTMPPALSAAYQQWSADGLNRKAPFELDHHGLEVAVSFTHLGSGRSGGTLVFLEDAAEMRQRAQQLKLASLGRLTGSIAHEIRNPLAAISHAGQLLSESPQLAGGDRRLTEIVAEHTKRVNHIIENVMMIGRRKLAISESFELRPWLESFIDELVERKGLSEQDIRCDWLDEDITARIDKSQLHQVLWNLCENALRYSHDKPLLAFVCGRAVGSMRPYIDLIDSGPGMSLKVAEQVFEPFYTGEVAGTGLGLYIARELCEANQTTLILMEHGETGCRFRINFAHPDRQQLTE